MIGDQIKMMEQNMKRAGQQPNQQYGGGRASRRARQR
jgi:hypothetical protein